MRPQHEPETGFRFTPQQAEAIYEEQIRIRALPAAGGGTALVADAEVAWFPVRPEAERIPAQAVTLIDIVEHERSVKLRPRTLSVSKVVTEPASIESVIAAVEALVPTPTPLSRQPLCGHDIRMATIELQFRSSSQVEPLAKLLISENACGASTGMSVGASELPKLTETVGFRRLLAELLGRPVPETTLPQP